MGKGGVAKVHFHSQPARALSPVSGLVVSISHLLISRLWLFSRGRGARLLDEVEAEPLV